MASALHISISAEPIAHFGSFQLTNSILSSLIVSTVLVLFFMAAGSTLKRSGKPSHFQSFVEFLVESFRNLVKSVVESDKKVEKFTPIVMAFFLFIILNNWAGLLPGYGTIGFMEKEPAVEEVHAAPAAESETQMTEGKTETMVTSDEHSSTSEEIKIQEAAPAENTAEAESTEATHNEGGTFVPYLRAGTADLNTTFALGLISVVLVQIYGFSAQKFGYFSKFINFSSPMNFAVGLLESVLEVAKIVSFAFRLFGNIFAGEVLLAVIGFLIPLVVPMPFYGLEIFVGFIQALVFSMLSLVFFNMATISHSEEH